MKKRDLEDTIHTKLDGEMSYAQYLCIGELTSLQNLRSEHHDEMLFIIQHQTSELWMKLIVHELQACVRFVRNDDLRPAFKVLARIGHIQSELAQQWNVLATLTPPEYLKFRASLGKASGFQSYQYRAIEFLLGNKNADMLKPHEHITDIHVWLKGILDAPSIYDEFLVFLARQGHPIPDKVLERDWSEPYEPSKEVCAVFKMIYENPNTYWSAYEMCEKLIDVEERFQMWRFKHLSTVRRIIGSRMGTGGSSGVPFLRKALDLCFFPELWAVRTELQPKPEFLSPK